MTANTDPTARLAALCQNCPFGSHSYCWWRWTVACWRSCWRGKVPVFMQMRGEAGMTTETDVKQRLAALRATLVGATMACPMRVQQRVEHGAWTDHRHPPFCDCQGTGEAAAFEGFRQACAVCGGLGHIESVPVVDARFTVDIRFEQCPDCSGLGWQARAGGMEDALAGLDHYAFAHTMLRLLYWRHNENDKKRKPDRDAILAEALKLVCKIKGLVVADATD